MRAHAEGGLSMLGSVVGGTKAARRRTATVLSVTLLLAGLLSAGASADAPTITDVSPGRSAVGGTVTISGSGFTGTTAVSFNGVDASFTEISDAEVTAVVPAGALTGPISMDAAAGSVQ